MSTCMKALCRHVKQNKQQGVGDANVPCDLLTLLMVRALDMTVPGQTDDTWKRFEKYHTL